MKKTLKRARKLFGRTAFAGVLSFFVWMSIQLVLSTMRPADGVVPPTTLLVGNILCLVLQSAIFIAIVYSDAWRWGDKDRNRANFGRIAPRPWYGFVIGLFANVPAILTFVLLVLDKLVGVWDLYIFVYRFFHMAFYPVVAWGLTPNMQAYIADIPWSGVLVAGIPVLLLPLVTAVAYRLGYAQFVITERLVYVNREKTK